MAGENIKNEKEEPEAPYSRHYSTFISFVPVVPEDGEDVTLAQLVKTPKRKSSSSNGKRKNQTEKNETDLKIKKRLSDWKIAHAISGPDGQFMSFEQNKAANDGGPCSPGQFKSSAVIRAQEVQSKLEQEFPSFVKSLVRSHVAGCFWMGLPAAFCKSHLPDKDIAITLENESGKQYPVKYIAYKTGLSAGWRQFSAAHKLLEGDVLVFQLVEPNKFKVYIVRANNQAEMDGALDLLNLDSHTKQNDAEKDTGRASRAATDSTNRKHPKSLNPLSVVNKNNKASPRRSVPKQPAEQSENDSEEVGEVLEGIKFSGPAVPFERIRKYDDFSIVVDGWSLDSELPEDIRRKYYKLCCSQNQYLHENLIQGINYKLVVGTISQTIHIADAIRASKLTTSRETFTMWDKTLRAFEIFGMNVGFLRTRLLHLVSLAYESEDAMDARRYVEARTERTRVEDEIKNIEAKVFELKKACERFSAAIESLESKARIYEVKFQEEVTAPW